MSEEEIVNEINELKLKLNDNNTDDNNDNDSDNEKLKVFLNLIKNYFQLKDYLNCEIYLIRSNNLISNNIVNDKTLLLNLKFYQAKIFDFKKDFFRSSLLFYQLSLENELNVEDRLNCLFISINLIILTNPSKQKSKLLYNLFRDERSSNLSNFSILKSILFEEIVSINELDEFKSHLDDHHLSSIPLINNNLPLLDSNDPNNIGKQGPSNILENSLIEHNLLAISKIYINISFKSLGHLLDLSPNAAQSIARRLIVQDKLSATIDQFKQIIYFDSNSDLVNDNSSLGGASLSAASFDDVRQFELAHAPKTIRWDEQIKSIASAVSFNISLFSILSINLFVVLG